MAEVGMRGEGGGAAEVRWSGDNDTEGTREAQNGETGKADTKKR